MQNPPPYYYSWSEGRGGEVRLLILSGLGGVWGVAINCWAKEGGRGEAINSFSPWGGVAGVSLKIITSVFFVSALRAK